MVNILASIRNIFYSVTFKLFLIKLCINGVTSQPVVKVYCKLWCSKYEKYYVPTWSIFAGPVTFCKKLDMTTVSSCFEKGWE